MQTTLYKSIILKITLTVYMNKPLLSYLTWLPLFWCFPLNYHLDKGFG
jgi:hypothetical protein